MAGVSRKEKELAQHVYSALQAVSCPLLEHLHLQEAGRMLQLLCTPSEIRTEILTWICSRIKPDFATSMKGAAAGPDPDAVMREMALVGQELMLCRANDLNLIKGEATPLRQLLFLQQLLTVVQDFEQVEYGEDSDADGPHHIEEKEEVQDQWDFVENLLQSQNLPLLSRMRQAELPPWPADVQRICDELKRRDPPAAAQAAGVEAVLQDTRAELEKLQSQCDFLSEAAQTAAAFCPGSLRVAACDLQQLMTAFSHVYESDLKDHCGREPPGVGADCHVFQRVQQLLLACNTELEILKELPEASASVSKEANRLQTEPQYWSGGVKHALPELLEELKTQISDYVSLLQSRQ